LPFVDALRGFALFGVFGANLMIFSGFTYLTEEQKASVSSTALDKAVYVLEQFFVENKFIGLFSVLFGISFWLFLDRARADSVTVALIGLQALTCALAGASAGTYLKRTSTGASRRSVLAWLVLLGSSAWLVFLLVLVTFLQTVADD
jgi:hypothetical protein